MRAVGVQEFLTLFKPQKWKRTRNLIDYGSGMARWRCVDEVGLQPTFCIPNIWKHLNTPSLLPIYSLSYPKGSTKMDTLEATCAF
ncbi:hypothetical protein V6N13_074155 [Hibiscus sabdariffa]